MLGATCNSKDKDAAYTPSGKWSLSVGYRKQASSRHFVGTQEQKQRDALNTPIVNNIHLFDIGVSYQFNPRWSFSASVPFMVANRERPKELDLVNNRPTAGDQRFHSAGIGDASIGARMWLFRPPTEWKGNIQLGFSLKMPTGNDNVTDTVPTIRGPVTQVVDQSIQLGDGGWGFGLDWQAFKAVKRSTLFFTGSYLFNPLDTNGVLTGRSRKSEAVMSVSDQYLYRGGIAHPLGHHWSVSAAGRMEGVPVRDAFGKSNGFRRPGYAISIEPGVNYSRGKDIWTFSLPVPIERNRKTSVPDMIDHTHGDAAFADYIIVAGYSHRF